MLSLCQTLRTPSGKLCIFLGIYWRYTNKLPLKHRLTWNYDKAKNFCRDEDGKFFFCGNEYKHQYTMTTT